MVKVWVHKGMDAPLLGFELVGDDNPKTVWPLADGRASRVLGGRGDGDVAGHSP